MKQPICYWQVAGFLFTSVFGTFLHFLFDLSGQSMPAALFSAVNESIWEHMKLIYSPMLLAALVEYYFRGKDHKQFWCIKLAGIGLALYLIPTLYYTYTGIFGVSVDWLNITIFFLAAGAGYWLENYLFQQEYACRLNARIAVFLIAMIGIIFTVFTFYTDVHSSLLIACKELCLLSADGAVAIEGINGNSHAHREQYGGVAKEE